MPNKLYIILLLCPLAIFSSSRPQSGVRLELSISPRTELAGAVGIYAPGDNCYMLSVGRIEDTHYIACYSETVLAISVSDHFGFWGAKQLGGGYVSKEVDKCGAYAGIAVGAYYRLINLFVFYSSITYVEDGIYRITGQIYIGIAVEFDY